MHVLGITHVEYKKVALDKTHFHMVQYKVLDHYPDACDDGVADVVDVAALKVFDDYYVVENAAVVVAADDFDLVSNDHQNLEKMFLVKMYHKQYYDRYLYVAEIYQKTALLVVPFFGCWVC